MKNRKTVAVILAAGIGSRMGANITKQKMLINGRSVISRSVGAFFDSALIDSIVVVGRAEELGYLHTELEPFKSKISAIVSGGATRFESARIGFDNIPTGTEFVAIHDAARPLVTVGIIDSVIRAAYECSAATDAESVYDTVKVVENGVITDTLDRTRLALARTPQVFSAEIYQSALLSAGDVTGVTDDNMMVERIGVRVRAVISDIPNPKITTASDLKYAEFLLNGGS